MMALSPQPDLAVEGRVERTVRWVFSLPDEVTIDEEIDDIYLLLHKPRLICAALSYGTRILYGLFACIIDSPGFVPAVFW